MNGTTVTVTDQVREIVADVLCVEPDWPTDDKRLKDAPSADSLDIVELQMRLEDAFDIILPDPDMAECRTVGDLVALVEKKHVP